MALDCAAQGKRLGKCDRSAAAGRGSTTVAVGSGTRLERLGKCPKFARDQQIRTTLKQEWDTLWCVLILGIKTNKQS